MNRKITIGLSWPYANNNLHIGHIASELPGDCLARYYRMCGDDVMMVSGTDSHGTKIELKARAQNVQPIDIVNQYDKNFRETFDAFRFSFDLFSKTTSPYHEEKCCELFKQMFKNGHIIERKELRPFCPKCNKFMADTELQFKCPVCGKLSKADNCDCGYVPNENDLIGATCLVCGSTTEQRENKVLVFKLTDFKKQLEDHVNKNEDIWRFNATNESKKYLKDLVDRDFSRELNWGITIPFAGYEDKKVYCWWEALLGYITDSMKVCEERGWNFDDFWKTTSDTEKRIYMIHAKDNIPFHTLLLPAMLLALEDNWCLPDYICSSEYLNMNNEKISKTQGGFDALNFAEKFDVDSLRFFFLANGPEKKDANYSDEVFIAVHNGEVVNKFGNIINRTLKFKGLETLPDGEIDKPIKELVKRTYGEVGLLIEKMEFKKACEVIMNLVAEANKFYDSKQPWVLAKLEDRKEFNDTIFTCAYIIANLSNLLSPFMPEKCKKIKDFLDLPEDGTWAEIEPKANISLSKVEPLFSRI